MMIDQVPAGLNSEDHTAGGAQCSLKCCLFVSVSFSQECVEIHHEYQESVLKERQQQENMLRL